MRYTDDVRVTCPVCKLAEVEVTIETGSYPEALRVDLLDTSSECECAEYLASLDAKARKKGQRTYHEASYYDDLLERAADLA